MEPTFLQTCDPSRYFEMMGITSRTVRAYCERHGYRYESYAGIKRGYWPWQACFNRIYMLQELVSRGFRGWAIYLDCDAYIGALDFDLRRYLETKSQFFAIMVPSGATGHPWDVNNGVMFFNFRDPRAGEVVGTWLQMFEHVSEDALKSAEDWDRGVESNQDMLQAILRSRPEILPGVHLESPELINSPFASFIAHHLRIDTSDLEARVKNLRDEVELVLGRPGAALPANQPPDEGPVPDMVIAAYAAILRRLPDFSGLRNYRKLIERRGIRRGLEIVIVTLLASVEYSGLPPSGIRSKIRRIVFGLRKPISK